MQYIRCISLLFIFVSYNIPNVHHYHQSIISTTYNDYYYDPILLVDPFYVEPAAFLSMVNKNTVVELCKIAQLLLLNDNDYY
jgi:hypothetical protein